MQGLARCDYFRTSMKIDGADICKVVGEHHPVSAQLFYWSARHGVNLMGYKSLAGRNVRLLQHFQGRPHLHKSGHFMVRNCWALAH